MADVFSQLYIQIVFAVKCRRGLIHESWQDQLHKYATGVIQARGHKLLAIGGVEDHIHLFIGHKPSEAISDLVREVKKATNHYVNENQLSSRKFDWQSGYGAFSYHRRDIDRICKYVLNQREHHRRKTFREEFDKLLKEFDIELGKKEPFEFFLPD